MKRYVFFTNSIRNMGGGQMYIRNKVIFLKAHGWTPTVYYYTKGKILIPELQEFENNRKSELAFPISTVSVGKREQIINSISAELNDAEECIIESHIYPGCYWMEDIAKRVNGRHLLFILHEHFPQLNSREEEYFKFKLDHGELMMSPAGIKNRLKKNWTNELFFRLPPYNNVTAPLNYELDYDKTIYTILSLGRLDKPYIFPMIKEINSFCEANDATVNLFFVGGAPDEKYITAIKSYLNTKNHIIPYFFGYMYPIPECIIKAANVAIASSGSILVPTAFKIPTIAIDTQDYMAIGIYGVTTNNTFIRKADTQYQTSELLKDVLIDKKYSSEDIEFVESNNDAEKILNEHLNIIESLRTPKEYFDIDSIYSSREITRQKIINFLYVIFDEEIISKLALCKKRLTNRFKNL